MEWEVVTWGLIQSGSKVMLFGKEFSTMGMNI